MKKTIITISAVGILLALGSCNTNNYGNWTAGEDGSIIVKFDDMEVEVDGEQATLYTNDKPATRDEQHSVEYITQRVKKFYELMDDQQCCSESYLKLRAQAEKKAKEKNTDLYEGARIMYNHWSLERYQGTGDKDWSYEILGVGAITQNHAMVLVNVGQRFGTKIKLHLVLERGDWYVDNFDIWTDVSFDGSVEVYEEQEVYYDEKEMMQEYIE